MISRAERAELLAAAVIGVIGDGIRIGHLEAPVFFGMVEVGRARIALARGPSGAIAHEPLEFHEAERRDRALRADAGGDGRKERVGQLLNPLLDVIVTKLRADEPDAAVDVVADAAG